VTCTDDILAYALIEEGGIDELLRQLVRGGLDPIQAIRCATLNGAYRLGRTDLGLVAAGRLADLVILSDLPTIRVDDVIAEGRWVASQGRMLADVPLSDAVAPMNTVKVPPLRAEAFQIRVPGVDQGKATVRVASGVRFRHWEELEVTVRGGVAELPAGYLIMASVHRHGRAEPIPACGVLGGWGDWTGAIATTVSHDTHNLVVFGRDPEDLAAAANALIRSGGGLAVSRRGQVQATLDLPVAGLLSAKPIDELAAEQRQLETAAFEVATFSTKDFRRPIFQVLAASLACNPGPCITDLGLVDGTTGERVELISSVG
jgi:adenine deaminase